MADISLFINSYLLEPLKRYNTVIQDTILTIISDRLQTLYDYTVRFPEIVSPDKNRMDILKAIADQFVFNIRDEADIQEQIEILDKILYVYSRRGSIDTIENMWKYYGGDLPKDVRVFIPAYNLFRYSVSKLSGTDYFPDEANHKVPGVYEIRLSNNTYPIPELREFLLRELVAAGTEIYFTNESRIIVDLQDPDSNPYKYDIIKQTTELDINLYCTSIMKSPYISSHLYIKKWDEENNEWVWELVSSEYPGYFVLGESKLGREVM